LKALSEDDKSKETEQIKELSRNGQSIRQIATKLNISKSKVFRVLDRVSQLSHGGTLGTGGTPEIGNIAWDYPPDLEPEEFEARWLEIAESQHISPREAARIVIAEHKAASTI
jgi:hypothetical protein